jgi:ATP-dependent DNA helicase RecQ
MQGKPVAEQEIGKQLLAETASYAETSICRRKSLLHYFGEEYPADNCHNCDNCLHPRKRIEAAMELCDAIETVIALKERFKADHVINVMIGETNNDIKSYRHDEIEMFGCQKDKTPKFLSAVISQGIIAGYLDRDIENYGLIKVTKKGKDFLEKPESFTVVEDRDFSSSDDNELRGGTSAIDGELFSILKSLRKKTASTLQLPPYVIFQDPSLEAMATTYPITMEELVNIPGVGAGKAKRYGSEFLKIIKRHVEDNEIIRPEDMRVRTVANKSKLKISLIQSIDRKVPLDDLAASRGLDFDKMLDEIEAIVYSGTRINIDYYINEIMDEEHMEDIFEYFKESESDALADAQEELGDEYTEEEIRLVRIKFLSEMGN